MRSGIVKAVWNLGLERPRFETLKGDAKTDVLIIGGGMAGILCANQLRSAGVDCILVEAGMICSGITENTTAKITYHHGAIFDKMIERFGKEKTKLYLNANKKALEKYDELCKNIDCDFERKSSFVYSIDDKRKIELEVEALNKMGCEAKLHDKADLPFSVAGAVEIKNQAQFNPLKFAFSIAKNIKIFENTRVLEIKHDGVKTQNGIIKAKKIIVATHFPFINKHGGYFLKMYQHRSYVIGLKGAQNVDGMYVDEAEKGLSFRNYKDMLLLGGGGHRTGKQGGNWWELREFTKKHYPNSQEICYWATQDCKTLDDIAYIGQYSKNTPNLYVATGFNKWGMTTSMVSANILTDLVLGKPNDFTDVFSPSRSILRPQLAINALESTVNLLTPMVPRCPHMGCALKYNSSEHTWDCPCHGSRFTKDGKLIDNPATKNI